MATPTGQTSGKEAASSEPLSNPLLEKAISNSRDRHFWSRAIIFVVSFFFSVEYSILMPTVWEYLRDMGQTKIFLGLTLGAFTLSQIVCMPFLGFLNDRMGFRKLFVISYCCGLIGNCMYGAAGKLNSPLICLFGRLICGVGASANVLNISYLSQTTRPEDMNQTMGLFMGCRLLGNVIGPALNAVIDRIDFTLFGVIEVNKLTSAGYLMAIPNFILMLVFATCFKDPPETKRLTVASSPADSVQQTFLQKCYDVYVVRGCWVFVLIQFTATYMLGAMETAVTPLTHLLGWGTMENSILFTGVSVIFVIGIILNNLIAKCDGDTEEARRVRPRKQIALSVVLMAFGILFALGYAATQAEVSVWSLCVFGAPFFMGLPMCITTSNAAYASKLDPGTKGRFMSFLQMSQAIGRTVGPLAGSLSAAIDSKHYLPLAVALGGGLVLLPPALYCEWRNLVLEHRDEAVCAEGAERGGRRMPDDASVTSRASRGVLQAPLVPYDCVPGEEIATQDTQGSSSSTFQSRAARADVEAGMQPMPHQSGAE